MINKYYENITYDNTPKTLLIITGIMIFTDIITGYLKAIKLKKINSSVSRDGYIKKIGWIVAIIFGMFMDFMLNINLFLRGSALVCIATEGMSIYENLNEIGVKLPFSRYFEKINGGERKK